MSSLFFPTPRLLRLRLNSTRNLAKKYTSIVNMSYKGQNPSFLTSMTKRHKAWISHPIVQKNPLQKKKLKKHREARHFWVCVILIYFDIPIFLYQISGKWGVMVGYGVVSVNTTECHIRCLTQTIRSLISNIMSYELISGGCIYPSGFTYQTC